MTDAPEATRVPMIYRIRCTDEPWWWRGENAGVQEWAGNESEAAQFTTQREARAAFDKVAAAYAPADIGLTIIGRMQ